LKLRIGILPSMPKILFLDESGDHSLAKIDAQYPVFALCGVIMDEQHHQNVATAQLDAFKKELFGTRKIVLHTADFTRNKAGFEAMSEHEFRTRFFVGLQGLVAGLDFKIVACVVKKQEHLKKYGLNALDPYLLSLSVLVERFIFECGSAGGVIVAEARDATLNNALELAFLDLKISGTTYIPATKIKRRIHNFAIREKRENIAGLQIADVVATPIGRHALGKTTYPSYCEHGDFFSAVRAKFRQSSEGKIEGVGLIELPK
jgi:hypothetical protein